MRSIVVLLTAAIYTARPIENKLVIEEPVELDLPTKIDEHKLGKAMLEASHDNHEHSLDEEQTRDA